MTTRDNFTVRSEITSTLTTVVACGEVDLDTAPLLRDELLRQLRPAARVRLHLAGVTFMDSSGLQVLLSSKRRAELLGADIGVLEVSKQVRRLLEISGTAGLLMASPDPCTASADEPGPPRRLAGRS